MENAFLIQEREAACRHWTIAKILKEMCALTDACTTSAKKDLYVNIGGFLATNDDALHEQAMNLCVVYEGLHTYGGLAGRDLEAMAVGVHEMILQENIAHRVAQVRALAEGLQAEGVPIVTPVGGHGVFVDARAFLPHLKQDELPAQALAAWLYAECGVRAMERHRLGGRGQDGQDHGPAWSWCADPAAASLHQSHLDFVVEGLARLWKRRAELPGLRFTYEPKMLRFFQSRFEPLAVRQLARN